MTNFTWIDYTVLVVYFLAMASLGPIFAMRSKTTEGYLLGDRSFPGWLLGFSMYATSISSITFVAYPGDAYKTAWYRMSANYMLPFALIFAMIYFLPFFRRNKITSAYEYLEARFGPYTRLYAAISFIIMQCTRVSIILYLVSIVIREMTGIDPVLSIYLGGIITALYTIMGGIHAVMWSDFIQAIIFIVGGLIVMFLIAANIDGGFGTIITEATAAGKFGMQDLVDGKLQPVPWGIDFTQKTVVLFMIAALSKWLYEYSANQNVIQRYIAARSIKDARVAMIICLVLSIPTWAMFMFIGTSLWVFFKHNPTEKATAILNGVEGTKAEQILPHFVIDYMPQGFTGLLIAAVLAAAMSTLSSNISAVSSVGLSDVYKRHLAKGKSDAHYLWAARGFGIAMAIIMIIGAVYLNTQQNSTLQDVATAVEQLTLGGLLGLYLLGFFTRIGDDRSVLVGIACTICWSLWMVLSNFKYGGQHILPAALLCPVHSYYSGLIGHTILFVVGGILASFIPRRGGDLKNLTIYTQDATPAD